MNKSTGSTQLDAESGTVSGSPGALIWEAFISFARAMRTLRNPH